MASPWPATFTGSRDRATGKFLAVVWENLADPIITGRCEIGHPKLYAEIAEPRRWNGAQICTAGWMGFRFLELEVSQLIAEGLTNKQIGAQLFISERTVASHVRSIMDKLGFNNRAQIAVWMTTPA